MKDTAKTMLLASFSADALALGAHWIYDTKQISATFKRVETYQKPGATSYHPTKAAGQFTHYGDQMLVLLESLAACRGFDLNHFSEAWQKHQRGTTGYIDHATRSTLSQFKEGKTPLTAGSESSDLGGASRIAPLIYLYRNDCDTLIKSVREQTAMTHNQQQVIDSAAFFAAAAFRILQGEPPLAAIEATTADLFNRDPFQTWVKKGIESRSADTIAAVARFGQMCEIGAAFPGVIHLIAKYENHLPEALIENVMAGGDSAARGMIAGMLLGAFHGAEALPESWLTELDAYPRINALMSEIDRLQV